MNKEESKVGLNKKPLVVLDNDFLSVSENNFLYWEN